MGRGVTCIECGDASFADTGTQKRVLLTPLAPVQDAHARKNMLTTRLKLIQPDLSFVPHDKPREIVTESSEEFFRLCERSDLSIEAVSVGRTNGIWVCDVRWK